MWTSKILLTIAVSCVLIIEDAHGFSLMKRLGLFGCSGWAAGCTHTVSSSHSSSDRGGSSPVDSSWSENQRFQPLYPFTSGRSWRPIFSGKRRSSRLSEQDRLFYKFFYELLSKDMKLRKEEEEPTDERADWLENVLRTQRLRK
ncbi:uncharacterized protein LOC141907644 [Tubulanus polymorphus]|uniref:uncharacterized protein LOC141907644 n=1 Tax=Tubulanus polymorphus TaxID=672921 RepID=UPI003DA21E5C